MKQDVIHNDSRKTKTELIKELEDLRQLIFDMENEHLRTDELIFQTVYSWEDTFNNITDMITIHDKDFNIIHANKAAEKILDLPFLKTGKAKCYRHYHGENSPPEGCPSCTCVTTGKPVQFEKFEPHLNRFLEIRAMPQFDSKHNLIGVIHIVRDITERKLMEDELQKAHDQLEMRVKQRTAELVVANKGLLKEIAEKKKAETALRDSESKFKRLSQEFNVLLDAIPDNIVLLSPDLEVMWVNKAAASELGKDGSETDGQLCNTLCCNFASNNRNCPKLKSLISGQEENAQISTPNGKFLDVRVFPITDESGNVKSFIEVARDITMKVRMEEEARLIQAKLIHANKMTSLGTLVSGVAHEINNPNTFIKSNSQLFSRIWKDVGPILEKYSRENGDFLLGGLPYSEVRTFAPEVIKGIDEGSKRIQHIVDNLRDFARPEKANLNGKVNINDLVDAATSILSNHINKSTENFRVSMGEKIPLVKGSAQQIEQVIINLIMNSLQALKDKKSAVQVSTFYNEKSGHAVIKIKDEGIGMTRDTLERITEPFFTTKLEEGGTGLGLSISYAIVKDHKGTLEFRSSYGKGTTSIVSLPVY